MTIHFVLLDVFANAPFQGTQIPVVFMEDEFSEDLKLSLASEFKQTETVFINKNAKNGDYVSVYNPKERTLFGAHTTLAASYMAHQLGYTKDEGGFCSFQIAENDRTIESFIDNSSDGVELIQFKRVLEPSFDRFIPETSRIAKALNTQEKHIAFSDFKPLLVSVDHPVLIVPFTKPEHILASELNIDEWSYLLSDVYATEILMFAPGSISGKSDFHGRIVNPQIARQEYPPIGKVMPEFIAYLAHQGSTAAGTHTFTIDRGSKDTRISVLHAEFDKRKSKETQCRIGGKVIKIGSGSLEI